MPRNKNHLSNRPLHLTAATAFAALLIPILTASAAQACQQHASYRTAKGKTVGDCKGQRVGPLSWTVRSSHPLVRRGSRQNSHMEVFLRGHDVKQVQRRPLNISLVLDRSGSMRGRKMADAKDAARRMVRLLAPGDVLSIVSYSDDVRVDWPAKRFRARDEGRILRVITGLRAGGSTFLEGGMRRGAQQVERYLDDRRASRVVLVSDGNANVGVQSGRALENIARRFGSDGISVTTVGLGLDYNEDTMTAIADGGSGNYYYVRESEELQTTFRTELRAMMATAARRIVVRIRLRDGVRLRGVEGFDAERDGDSYVVSLPDLGEKAERSLLIELSVPSHLHGERDLAEVELRFRDMEGATFAAWSSLGYRVTADGDEAERARDWTVLKRVEELRIAKALKDSAKLVQEGKGAEAQQRINTAVQRAERVQKNVNDKRLSGYLRKAKSRAAAAPAAARADRSAREAYNKSNKAEAFGMAKY